MVKNSAGNMAKIRDVFILFRFMGVILDLPILLLVSDAYFVLDPTLSFKERRFSEGAAFCAPLQKHGYVGGSSF